ncbi:MAG: ABC transporter permease, partial [Chloroflexota bacterium]
MRSLNSLARRNLTAHPLRSALTALAIALGVGMVLAAAVVGQAAGRGAADVSDTGPRVQLEVFARDDALFEETILSTLRAAPEVEWLSPMLHVEAEGVNPIIPRLVLAGVDPQVYQTLHQPDLAGGDFLDRPDTVVLPVAIALGHNLNIGDAVTLRLGERSVTLTVAGRLETETNVEALAGGSSTAFAPLPAAQSLLGAPGQLDRVQIALRPGADVEQTRAELARTLGPELAVVRAAAEASVLGNVVLVQAALVVVGLIILLAAGFVILNAFAMSITGRTREIGALRALGMTRRQVMGTVLVEAGLLGLIGTAAGLIAGAGLAWSVMRIMGALQDAPFAVPWWGLVASVLMGLGVTLLGALQPAWR